MQIVTKFLGTNTDTTTDVGTLRTRHSEAAGRVAAGRAELERLTANVEKLRLDRARLIDQRDSDPGVDLYVPIRKVEGELNSAQRRCDDLADILKIRQETAETLAAEVRSAEQAAAPGRMAALAREHAQDREALRVAMEEIRSLAARIITAESDMQALYHAHGIKAENVLIIEGLAVSAQATANDALAKLEWQDDRQRQGDALADKIGRDRAEADRRNAEAGYPLYRAPGSDYFKSGWLEETREEQQARH